MTVAVLIEALDRHGIAKVAYREETPANVVYRLEGRLPEFPFRRRVISYELIVGDEQDVVPWDRIDALLRHFWQGQIELVARERE